MQFGVMIKIYGIIIEEGIKLKEDFLVMIEKLKLEIREPKLRLKICVKDGKEVVVTLTEGLC